MKKFRKTLSSPLVSGVLFALAAVLIILASINGARAAVNVFSEAYRSEIELYDIGVTLMENGDDISWRNYNRRANADRTGVWVTETGELLGGLQGTQVQLGHQYDEVITAKNSGTIDQYVRVTITKYWEVQNEKGKWVKTRTDSGLTPDLIDITYDERYVTTSDSTATEEALWIEDTAAATDERRVFYYKPVLRAGAGEESVTKALTKSIAIKEGLADVVSYSKNGTIAYRYEGKKFVLEATVDAVQDHHAEQAKMSAWGQTDPKQ